MGKKSQNLLSNGGTRIHHWHGDCAMNGGSKGVESIEIQKPQQRRALGNQGHSSGRPAEETGRGDTRDKLSGKEFCSTPSVSGSSQHSQTAVCYFTFHFIIQTAPLIPGMSCSCCFLSRPINLPLVPVASDTDC